MSQGCIAKGCNGRLVSLYYKINKKWYTLKEKKVCTKCESIHTQITTIQKSTTQ